MKNSRFIFTVIGSREAPIEHCESLFQASVELLRLKGLGRSGGAGGPDTSLTNAVSYVIEEQKCRGADIAEIYLPSEHFNELSHGYLRGACIWVQDKFISEMASAIARIARGGFFGLNLYGKLLHTRNSYQVLGADLITPTDVLLISAKVNSRGVVQGGTATAVKIAIANDIPVINLQVDGGHEELAEYVKQIADLPLDAPVEVDIRSIRKVLRENRNADSNE